jgi:hypothetical protein
MVERRPPKPITRTQTLDISLEKHRPDRPAFCPGYDSRGCAAALNVIETCRKIKHQTLGLHHPPHCGGTP